MKADLHMHSVYSDGTKTPTELILRAKEKGLTHVALSDHDSINGVDEMIEVGVENNITVIKSIELSTYYNGESVHLLGYFLNKIGQGIIDFSNNQLVSRRQRAKDMSLNMMKYYNLEMDYNVLLENKGMITRAHMVKELHRCNPHIPMEECSKYLSEDSKAYIKSSKTTTADGIKMLKENNAIVVVAHPTLLKKTNIEDIIKLGVDGLEGYYPKNKENQHLDYIELAKKYNLMITAGSDYHGVIDFSHEDMGTVYLEDNLFKRY